MEIRTKIDKNYNVLIKKIGNSLFSEAFHNWSSIIKICIIFFLCFFFLLSCNQEQNEQKAPMRAGNSNTKTNLLSGTKPTANETPVNSPVKIEGIKKSNIDTAQLKKMSRNLQKQAKVTTTEEMKEFLPKKINGFTAYPFSAGSSLVENNVWSTVSGDYLGQVESYINITIYDYGQKAAIPDRIYYSKIPEESGFESKKISVPGGIGYTIWRPDHRDGRLHALIGERFTIKIEAYHLPKGTDLPDILRMIDLGRIKQIIQ